ncbi:aminoacylase-1-like isoform X2 [Belonocnema kinseyi]|uniref:aminoacylase-1-like isoform X2 n=1 Tax=Belonocnema kinseyi TaxID=2817044 RepID=UPI00143CEA1E|nr:aminoacylase-1-like isoform X2 [Belonocnema kinseyi]
MADLLVLSTIPAITDTIRRVEKHGEKMAHKFKEIFLFLMFFIITYVTSEPVQSQLDNLALENLLEYLRIPSVQPDVNYDDCVKFLKKQAHSLGLPIRVFEPVFEKPIVVITWEGLEPENPSILLNGHMDVVPVYPAEWKYPPFAAHMDEEGNIYARGSQDTKSSSIQHIEAIRRLKLNGIRLKRTIHMSFVPDEEIGGKDGMEAFVATQDFKNLNIGFALDEGVTTVDNTYSVSYAEKTRFPLWVHCRGNPGHGSTLFNNTAGEKLRVVIDRFMDFRASEKAKLKDPKVQPGEVTSVNLDMIQGGVQVNVIPNELSVAFDIRVAPGTNLEKFEKMVNGWLEEAGEGVNYTIIAKDVQVESTKLDDSNPFWIAFKKTFDDFVLKLEPIIISPASDSRFLRAIGIPALGFAPMINTTNRMHASNEYLNKDVFLEGIDIFMKIIPTVANV